ncbi:MAG: hypothetical protein RRZ24_00145 [Clostridia bacterium]
MRNNQKWFITVMITLLIVLLFIGTLVAIVDPFFHYHKPLSSLAYPINNSFYQNPGIVRNFGYDSIVLGSSMAHNFKTSWFEKIMDLNAVKVSYSGATTKYYNVLLNVAFRHNKNIKKVFCGLDTYALEWEDFSHTRHPLPEYLYNENILDDVKYLFNKDVLFGQIKDVFVKTYNEGKTTTFDEASYDDLGYPFGEKTILDKFGPPPAKLSIYYDPKKNVPLAKANVENNILPLIQSNPEVDFYLFFPPYSILIWYARLQCNELDVTINELDAAIEALLPYKNVKLFYFQNIEEIVGNLYLYNDYSHYNAQINHYMTQCFQNGKHQLTKDNYKAELQKMKMLAENFDYDLFWGDEVLIKKEENLARYLQCLNNPDYLAIISVQTGALTSINETMAKGLHDLGFQCDLRDSCGYSYFGILNSMKVQYEEHAAAALSYSENIDGIVVDAISQGYDTANPISIKIDGVEYSKNGYGINIVVYDKLLKRVIDSVCFDTNNNMQAIR